MRKLTITAAVLATGAAGITAIPALAATKTVKATSTDRWSPKSLTVRKGDTVRFTWNTAAPHNVRKTSGKGTVKGGNPVRRKGTATFKVPAKGTFRFICDVHPGTMKITIRAR